MDKKNDFQFLFDHIEFSILEESFLRTQCDILYSQLENEGMLSDQTVNDIAKLTVLDRELLDEAIFVKPFILANSYPLLNSDDKQLFDEISIIACANYLSENPQKSIKELDKNQEFEVDELIFLAAIINHKLILVKLANYFNCQPYQVVFNDKVYALREVLKLSASTRTFGNPSTTWYQLAKRYAVYLKLSKSVLNCVTESFQKNKFNVDCFVETFLRQRSPKIKKFLQINRRGNSTIKAAMNSQHIQNRLSNKVIGQASAIDGLCQGYLTSSIDSQQGPRSIYTFVGPSGVGKTYLASQLLPEINKFEQTGYVYNIFNMEHYSDERDAQKLFGSGIQYSDSSMGMLTTAVRAQPRQILLLDEIEKAHSTVIQSLLSILDSGITRDQTSQEKVDFSQCIIIFTTNLGQDVLQNNHQNSTLSIFELLRESKNPSNNTKLSIEFINRLAKGFPILFSELKINHLVRIAELQVNSANYTNMPISYDWPRDFASLMLQSMSPDISVRGLQSCLTKHQSLIISKATRYFTEDTDKVSFKISIEQSTSKTEKSPIQLLLLDDDSRVFGEINNQHSNCKVSLCAMVEGLHHAIEMYHPDALLIDIETVDKSKTQLPELISDVLGRNDKTPVFTYQIIDSVENDENQSICHEVREHFSLNVVDFASQFSSMLARVQYYLDVEFKLFNMKRRNEKLQYHCEVMNTENEVYNVVYNQLSASKVIQSSDLTEGDLFKYSLPNVKLDDVIGLERAKKRLDEVVNWLKSPDKLANFGIKPPCGFLFSGPPGTGKTFLAKALAGESGLPFFSVSSSELSESHSGGTTQNIKKLFATARKYAPAIIFIDEIDAIASKRSESTQGADRDRNLAVNALLTEMDGFTPQSDPIFILAATNHPQLLDSAIVRPGRFDETIHCDLPNKQARSCFFIRFSTKHQINFTDAELNNLIAASQGMSSAEIEQVFREAIYQAVGENKMLTSEAIKKTMIRVTYGLPSEHIVLSRQEKNRTAYHEAGHLLISKLLFPNHPIDFVTIEPRNQTLGFVATRDADEYESLSSIRAKHRLEMLLAGRVAEKIYTNSIDEISSGASNDIVKATQLAMHVIYEGGLDPSVGPVNVGILTKFEESELLMNAQKTVKLWLESAEKSVEVRLIEHRLQLDRIANALIENESLIAEEIEALFV
ncbi:AAA family ATPase [Psychromonas antarctica]|uniref:AAA family ATPase n=1 Tax=Psychromonas antarctica TaxID=67573 RepID=UPI001EE78844|nr:AAA family ATPase [Psychromonas antarctica]MCG6202324.1 AAA family ATPase [Psychromonas antarctica]